MLFLMTLLVPLPGQATEYVVPTGDVGAFFRDLPKDATVLRFTAAAEYTSNGDIELPPARMLIIDGAGCRLRLGPASRGFTCVVADQQQAMDRVSGRYVIQDFAAIEGGRKAIDLAATLGSTIRNCKLIRQTEAAVDLRFCLMARLEQVLVTNPGERGIVLRQGDWPGATAFNSQSNSCVLEQCRVNCASTTTAAYSILNSGGVRMSACVSEGAPCDHDVFLSASTDGDEDRPAGNTVVKSFTLENFHVEHAPRIASIHVNMPSRAAVILSNIYWNGPQKAPVIHYVMGQLNLSDIGWWHESFEIHTRLTAPRINIDRCHGALRLEKEKATPDRAGPLRLVNSLSGGEALKLMYVHVTRPSM